MRENGVCGQDGIYCHVVLWGGKICMDLCGGWRKQIPEERDFSVYEEEENKVGGR